jgi:hypothetical protein
MAYLSYLGAHWTLFVLVVLGVIACGAAAWFLRNWRYAVVALVLVFGGFAYQAVDMEGYKRRVNEDAQVQVNLLQKRLLALSIVSAKDTQRAVSDAYLNTKLKDLARDTPANAGPCLDAAAAHRVWTVRSTAISQLAPARTHRVSNVLPWRNAKP